MKYPLWMLCLLASALPLCAAEPPVDKGSQLMARYNVVWDAPSVDATGSMPVGNGDLGANVYAVTNGDFYLLLGKTDAYDGQGNVCKTGRVRVHLDPNPLAGGLPFQQVLDIVHGCVDITAGGVALKVWVDANHPVYHVEIHSDHELTVTAVPEFWPRQDHIPDVILTNRDNLTWYHASGAHSRYAADLKYYGIPQLAATHPDPFQYNTFGGRLESPQLRVQAGQLTGHGRRFDLRIHSLTRQTPDATEWLNLLAGLARANNRQSDWGRHCAWWQDFWNRSWITARDNTLPPELSEHPSPPAAPGVRGEKDGGYIVAQSYNVHRYIMACQGRGRYQVQFNGGIFTVPFPNYRKHNGSLFGEDERDWGSRFTFQNQRLLYWPMIAAGDTDLIQPFFNYYFSILDLRKAITQEWFGHGGAYYRENVYLTGAEMDDSPYSHNKPPRMGEVIHGWYHNYHFNSGLEMTTMALACYRNTQDPSFRDGLLLPLARETIAFYDLHYPRDAAGKIHLAPSQVLETFWQAVNPTPDVAGLHYLLAGLLGLDGLPANDRTNWQRLLDQLPAVPMRPVDGKSILAPADSYSSQNNAENGELYAVFPYRLFGVPEGNTQIIRDTMPYRTVKNGMQGRCWTQDQIDFACAGMAEEARDGLIHRFSQYSTHLRLPMFAKEDPDYAPDFDSNGSGSVAFQAMVLQESLAGKIFLAPAWPTNWDGEFKLHASGQTVVSGRFQGGKLHDLTVTPAVRRADVTVCAPW